ncbi:MAG TPA: lipocalin family protein [Chthoniobacter sp.]|nr:lipocalin family protein [Chthoniobacter sp.]
MKLPRFIFQTAGLFLGTAALAMLAGCVTQSQTRPLPTVKKADLRRYSGQWYEIARLKNRFQREGESAMAEYKLLSETSASVHNTATTPSGKVRSIEGTATVVPGSNGARLRVKFHGLAALVPASSEGNYWIIALDPGYRSAMVGTPDRKYLWILSREPRLSEATKKAYLKQAESLGFSLQDLVWDPRPAAR